jgi:DNA invertase Pin-like site-specific DNA recombinase
VVIGYLRGRAEDIDDLALQRQALAEAQCEQIVEELAAGRGREQPKLLRVLGGLQVGDVLVVPRMGTLGRSMAEVVRRVQYIAAASVGLRSLKGGVDTTTEAGRTAVGVISGLAQLGRSAVRKLPGAGSEAARTQGHRAGRKPKLTRQQRASIVEEVLSGRETAAKMARHHKVSEATVSRVMSAHRAKGDVPEASRPPIGDIGQGKKIAGALPLSALDERLAIVGTSGSGKTYAARGW